MRLLGGEAHDLVFDRRAIARANTFDDACVQRRAVQVVADDLVRARCGMDEVARKLAPPGRLHRVGQRVHWIRRSGRQLHVGMRRGIRTEVERRLAADLRLRLREVYRARVDAWWRARLEATHREAELTQRIRDAQRGALTSPPAGLCLLADH